MCIISSSLSLLSHRFVPMFIPSVIVIIIAPAGTRVRSHPRRHCAAMTLAMHVMSLSSHWLAPASVPPLSSLLTTTLYHRGTGLRNSSSSSCRHGSGLPVVVVLAVAVVVTVAIAVACIPSMSSCATVALARRVLSSSCCHGSGRTSPHHQHRHHRSRAPSSSSSSSPCPVVVTVTHIHWQSASTRITMVVRYRRDICNHLQLSFPHWCSPSSSSCACENGQNGSVRELAQYGCGCEYRARGVQGTYPNK